VKKMKRVRQRPSAPLGLRWCSKCKENRPVEEFQRNSALKDGVHCWCKPCCKKYKKVSYIKQRERMEADPGFRDAFNERSRRNSRLWEERHPLQARIRFYRNNAKRRGIEYDLDPLLFEDLSTDRCFYCHADPEPFNGVDRVDNTKGYTENNVVSCCKTCNLAKKELTREEFESWAMRVADVARRCA
jgi:hypothetical protein